MNNTESILPILISKCGNFSEDKEKLNSIYEQYLKYNCLSEAQANYVLKKARLLKRMLPEKIHNLIDKPIFNEFRIVKKIKENRLYHIEDNVFKLELIYDQTIKEKLNELFYSYKNIYSKTYVIEEKHYILTIGKYIINPLVNFFNEYNVQMSDSDIDMLQKLYEYDFDIDGNKIYIDHNDIILHEIIGASFE